MTQPIALAGIGKIARDQHIPAIAQSPDWELAAAISRNAGVDGVEGFEGIDAFLEARPGVAAVSLALPPKPRFAYAVAALSAGRHVMIEKPPGTTITEVRTLRSLAQAQGVVLYASWHSRMGAAVPEAKARLKGQRLRRLRIEWLEDVRQFHPDQDWVWDAGNLGVFDPGINAMSILTEILEDAVHLSSAGMEFPENRQTPIAADLAFHHPGGAEVSGRLDWRHEGDPVWDMEIETDAFSMRLTRSGSGLAVDGETVMQAGDVEYANVYARFAELVREGRGEVDLRPMEHVADAFLLGERRMVAPFSW